MKLEKVRKDNQRKLEIKKKKFSEEKKYFSF